MHFALSKELEMLRKAIREFADKKIAPNADEWDANHYFPYKEARTASDLHYDPNICGFSIGVYLYSTFIEKGLLRSKRSDKSGTIENKFVRIGWPLGFSSWHFFISEI